MERTLLGGSVPEDVCVLALPELSTDCLPLIDPPIECECCTKCCNRETGKCDEMLA